MTDQELDDYIEIAARLGAVQFLLEVFIAEALVPVGDAQAKQFLDEIVAKSRSSTLDPTAPLQGDPDRSLKIATRTTAVLARFQESVLARRQKRKG